jgi:Cd2+/Zn2+-exporting ATPase
MTTELKKRSIIYGAGVFIYVCAIATTTHNMMGDWAKFIWFLIAYLIIGYDVFRVLCEKFFQKKFLTEYTLITLATVGAFGIGRYTEGVLVMLLFELGVIFEAYSTDSAKRSIEEMIDIRPPYATKKSEAGEVKVQPSELEVGDLIVIKPGERIPVDAIVKTGSSMVDTKAVTGESMPRKARESSFIYSGCINLSGVLEAKVVKVYNDSTVSKIMDMVEDAQKRQSESETFISKFSRVYTPVMFCFALFVMIYPPLTFSYGNWSTWVYRGLIFLIAACPSGLVMSVPIAFLGGLASAARQGIVIKGANYLEDLAQADTFVFDKTGTLTEGVFTVREIHPVQTGEEELLEIAAHAESYSNHPIARALLDAYGEAVEKDQVSHVKELPGYGVTAVYDGQKILVGNYHLLEKYEIPMDEVESTGTVIYIAVDKKYAGYIIISDALKKDARWTLRYLKEKCQGVLVMLTGDTESSAMETAQELDMDYAYTDLLPGDKLEQLEDFLMVQDARERLVCVGDGINDAPVLARADVGIAMGALGSAAAIEAADIVLMEDELSKIVDAIRISKETLRVVNHNITFALAIKFMILFFAVVGYFGMWEAIIAEVAVVFIAILNAAGVVRYVA